MGPTWVLSAPVGPHAGPWTLLSGSVHLVHITVGALVYCTGIFSWLHCACPNKNCHKAIIWDTSLTSKWLCQQRRGIPCYNMQLFYLCAIQVNFLRLSLNILNIRERFADMGNYCWITPNQKSEFEWAKLTSYCTIMNVCYLKFEENWWCDDCFKFSYLGQSHYVWIEPKIS